MTLLKVIVLSRFLGKFKNLKQTVGLPYQFYYFFLEILKKKKKKKNPENDQLTGHFQSFLFIFIRPPDLKSEKQFP